MRGGRRDDEWWNCRGESKGAMCKQVAEWLVDAYTNIPEQVARNAWLKKGRFHINYVLHAFGAYSNLI